MARTSNARIVEWGTPPEPEPTGWDAVLVELEQNAGSWANVGDFTRAAARKIIADKFPEARGFEARLAPTETGRVVFWVRKTDADAADADQPTRVVTARPKRTKTTPKRDTTAVADAPAADAAPDAV